MRITASFVAVLALINPSISIAQDCSSYLGQVISPMQFEQAANSMPKIEPKGEFETSADYNARISAASNTSSQTIFISKSPGNQDYIQYDADNQRFAIMSQAFTFWNLYAWEVFSGTPYGTILNASTFTNIEVGLEEEDTAKGTYVATNSFGSRTVVTKIDRQISGIFERPTDYSKGETLFSGLFPNADQNTHIVGHISIPPELARDAKAGFRLAFGITPRFPYVVRNTSKGSEPTIDNPTDVTKHTTIIIADIKCGIVMDRTNKVLGSYPTR